MQLCHKIYLCQKNNGTFLATLFNIVKVINKRGRGYSETLCERIFQLNLRNRISKHMSVFNYRTAVNNYET